MNKLFPLQTDRQTELRTIYLATLNQQEVGMATQSVFKRFHDRL